MQRACENTQPARPPVGVRTQGVENIERIHSISKGKCRKVANGRGVYQVFSSKMEQKQMQNLRRNGL